MTKDDIQFEYGPYGSVIQKGPKKPMMSDDSYKAYGGNVIAESIAEEWKLAILVLPRLLRIIRTAPTDFLEKFAPILKAEDGSLFRHLSDIKDLQDVFENEAVPTKTCGNCAHGQVILPDSPESWIICQWSDSSDLPFWKKAISVSGALSPWQDRSGCRTWKQK